MTPTARSTARSWRRRRTAVARAWPTAPTASRARKPARNSGRRWICWSSLSRDGGARTGDDLGRRLRRAPDGLGHGARRAAPAPRRRRRRRPERDLDDVELEALDQLVVGVRDDPRAGVVGVVRALRDEGDPADAVGPGRTVSPPARCVSPTPTPRSSAVSAASATSSLRRGRRALEDDDRRAASSTGSMTKAAMSTAPGLQHALAACRSPRRTSGSAASAASTSSAGTKSSPLNPRSLELRDLAEALRVGRWRRRPRRRRSAPPPRRARRRRHPTSAGYTGTACAPAPAVEGEARADGDRDRGPGPRRSGWRRARPAGRRPAIGASDAAHDASSAPPATSSGMSTSPAAEHDQVGVPTRGRARRAPPCPIGNRDDATHAATTPDDGADRPRPASGPAAAATPHVARRHPHRAQHLQVRVAAGRRSGPPTGRRGTARRSNAAAANARSASASKPATSCDVVRPRPARSKNSMSRRPLTSASCSRNAGTAAAPALEPDERVDVGRRLAAPDEVRLVLLEQARRRDRARPRAGRPCR